jgi:hypothetical protein
MDSHPSIKNFFIKISRQIPEKYILNLEGINLGIYPNSWPEENFLEVFVTGDSG